MSEANKPSKRESQTADQSTVEKNGNKTTPKNRAKSGTAAAKTTSAAKKSPRKPGSTTGTQSAPGEKTNTSQKQPVSKKQSSTKPKAEISDLNSEHMPLHPTRIWPD